MHDEARADWDDEVPGSDHDRLDILSGDGCWRLFGGVGQRLQEASARLERLGHRGQRFRQLTFGASAALPSISPDGRQFLFVRREGKELDIFLQRVGGQNAAEAVAQLEALLCCGGAGQHRTAVEGACLRAGKRLSTGDRVIHRSRIGASALRPGHGTVRP